MGPLPLTTNLPKKLDASLNPTHPTFKVIDPPSSHFQKCRRRGREEKEKDKKRKKKKKKKTKENEKREKREAKSQRQT